MAEIGCLKDGCFQNLQVEGKSDLSSSVLTYKRNIISSITATQAFLASESGSILLIDDLNATCTLPTAEAGLEYWLVCGGIMDGFTLTCAAADCFVGTLKVTSTTDDVTSSDEVVALGATASDSNVMTLDGDAATSGGQPGDTLHIVALNATSWLVTGVLTTSHAVPASINIFG
jgi:hypothetical protein